jgi:large subunit ribosomal protein L35
MPKLKTKSAAAARFRVTGGGKIIRRGRGIRHLLEHLPSKIKRRRQKDREISVSDYGRVSRLLPYR